MKRHGGEYLSIKKLITITTILSMITAMLISTPAMASESGGTRNNEMTEADPAEGGAYGDAGCLIGPGQIAAGQGIVTQEDAAEAAGGQLPDHAGLDTGEAGLDAVEAGLDTVQAGLDAGETGLDADEEELDTVQAGLDAVEEGLDTVQAGLDAGEAGLDADHAELFRTEAAASGGKQIPVKGKKPEVPRKGITSDGWEYEYLDNRDGHLNGVYAGEYMLLKSFKGVSTDIEVPFQLAIKTFDEYGNESVLPYNTLVMGGKKTRTRFPAEIRRISFSGSNTVTADMSYLFSGYKKLEYIGITHLDTSRVTNMSNLFQGCTRLTLVDGLNSLEVGNVTDISSLFASCISMDWIEMGRWTCRPTNITAMLQGCTNAYFLDIQRMDFSGVTAARSKNAFTGTTRLRSIWTPLNIPTDFSIPLAGVYSIWEDVNTRTSLPRTTILAPAGQNRTYGLGKCRGKARDDDSEKGPGTKHVESVNLNQGYVVLEHGGGKVGRSVLVADVFPRDAANRELTWSSTNTRVVSVKKGEDDTAEIITKGPGFADVVVTTKDGGKTATCSVTVKKYTNFIEESTGEENTDRGGTPNYELIAGQSYDLEPELQAQGIFDKLKKDKKCISGFELISTNPRAVATSQWGMLEAKDAGLSFLAQKYKDHGKLRQSTIMGTRIRVYKPGFNTATVNLTHVGQSFKGSDNIIYSTCPVSPSSWASANDKVATVDGAGNVVATGTGTTKIRVTWTNAQNYSATYAFTVKVQTPTISKKKIKLLTGQTQQLSMNNIPQDSVVVWQLTNTEATGRDKNEWEVNYGDVVELGPDELGHNCRIKGVLPGDVFVTAIVDGVYYDCYVEVPRPELKLGNGKFKVTNTSLPAGSFVFHSSDPKLIEIGEEDGVFYDGHDFPDIDGSCTVMATCYDKDGAAMMVISRRVETYVLETKNGMVQYARITL